MGQLNLWSYIINALVLDVFPMITFGHHTSHGIREYFGGVFDNPILAIFLVVGTFLDLNVFAAVCLVLFASAPFRFQSVITLRLLRIIDKLPFVP